MKEYLLSIAGICLISSMIAMISPSGKMSGVVKSGARLLTLLVIVAPVIGYFIGDKEVEDLFSDFYEESVIEMDESFIEYCSEKQIDDAEEKLQEELKEKFSIDGEVNIVWRYLLEEDGRVRKIVIDYVLLQGIEESKQEEIAVFILQKYGCEVHYDEE